MLEKHALHHHRIVMLLVPRPEYERNRSFAGQPKQLFKLLGMTFEFGPVALLELGPELGIMTEPLSQFRARGDFTEPVIDSRLLLGYAAGP